MFEAVHYRVMCWWCASLAFVLGLISVNDSNFYTAMIFIALSAALTFAGWYVERKK